MEILTAKSLIDRRQKLRLSQADLADKSKIALTTLWRIEEGKVGGTIGTWRTLLEVLDSLEKETQ